MRSRLLTSLALASALAACSRSEPPPARNVLLIVCDTLRADRLSCYGYGRPTSPHIDALAERGTLYEKAFANASWTVPSMISMLSGVPVTKNETTLPEKLPALAELLQARGIRTAAFTANAVLRYDHGFDRGIDHFEDLAGQPGPVVAERFGAWLGEHAARSGGAHGEPGRFFAWVQFFDPHDPYEPLPEFDVFRGPREDQAGVEARWRAALPELRRLVPDQAAPSLDDAIAAMVAVSNLYDGEVLQTDAGVGGLMDQLRAHGVLEDTLVVLAADHGEMLYEQRTEPLLTQTVLEKSGSLPGGVADLFSLGHRWWFFESMWNTPLILAGPGIPAGVRREGMAQNLDVFPTVLEALGLGAPAYLAGSSLFGGRESALERVLASGHGTFAVREAAGWKLMQHPRQLFQLEGEGAPPVRLFDLASDPSEQDEVSAARADQVERLGARIEAWRSAHDREVNSELSQRALEDLRALGYVDSGF